MFNIKMDLSSLRGAKCFVQLDFAQGYWQIPMSKEDSILHAFRGVDCIMVPNGTLQGGKNDGQHFQSEFFKKVSALHESLLEWIDDYLMHARTPEELRRTSQQTRAVLLDLPHFKLRTACPQMTSL